MSWAQTNLVSADVSPDDFIGLFDNPGLLLGIPLAIAGAVFMSLGAQYQSRGVRKVEAIAGLTGKKGLRASHLLKLFSRPSWVMGTLLLIAAIVCQLSALAIAPLIVVQPLGAVSLVVTTMINAHYTGHMPTKASMTAVALCLGGIFVFVAFAALYAVESPLDETQLLVLLVILMIVLIGVAAAWLIFKTRAGALFYITGAGVLYGFVATLAKVIITRVQAGNFDFVTIACGIALAAAGIAGAYFVQTAYASGPPDLVIAGLHRRRSDHRRHHRGHTPRRGRAHADLDRDHLDDRGRCRRRRRRPAREASPAGHEREPGAPHCAGEHRHLRYAWGRRRPISFTGAGP